MIRPLLHSLVQVVVSDIPEHRSLIGPDYPFYFHNLNNAREAIQIKEKAILNLGNKNDFDFTIRKLELMKTEVIADTFHYLFFLLVKKND